jgi:hypothetical protein
LHKSGARISASYRKFECGFCSKAVKTLEKVAIGDWRCIRCVGITDLNSVVLYPRSPTALMLLAEYEIPLGGLTVLVIGCDNCEKPYKVTELDARGYPIHPKLCNDCCKQCATCGEWHTVRRFWPNKESSAYEDWITCQLGPLVGRENYLDECITCRPYQDSPAKKASPKKYDTMERLEKLLAAARG